MPVCAQHSVSLWNQPLPELDVKGDLRMKVFRKVVGRSAGEKVHGAESRDMRTSKEYRKDPAAGHKAETWGKIVNKFPTGGMSTELVNKRTFPF